MNSDLSITLSELHIILNSLWTGDSTPEVFVPYLRRSLLRFATTAAGSTLQLNYHSKTYKQEAGPPAGKMEREIPGFNILQECLMQSGLVTYPNLKRLLSLLARQCSREYQPGKRPLFLSLDTNLLRDRFFSTQQHWLRHLPAYRVGMAFSPYTNLELGFTRGKYQERGIAQLGNSVRYPALAKQVSRFFNQNMLEDRRRRLGALECEKMRRLQWSIELPLLEEEELQPSGDANIILTLQRAIEDRDIDILLLSRDHDFVSQAQGIPGIHGFPLETPVVRGNDFSVDKRQRIAELLYCLAVCFGAIELRSGSVALQLSGIWTGKRPADWSREQLQLQWQTHSDLTRRIERNLRIVAEMEWQNKLPVFNETFGL